MIWLTWRQLRLQSTVVLVAAVALALALVVTAGGLSSAYTADLQGFIDQLSFKSFESFLYLAGLVAVHAAAPVIAAFWGGPLVARELEAGTHRLVWNQSTTRHRWLAMKLLIAGGMAAAVVGLLSLVVTWWSSPIDKAVAKGLGSGRFSLPRIDPAIFGARGIVTIGYVLFGLALGVALGLVLRRSIAAVAVTLVLVAAAQILVPQLIRPHLAGAVSENVVISTENMDGLSIGGSPGMRGVARIEVRGGAPADWSLSNHTVDGAGRTQATLPASFSTCVGDRLPGPPMLDGGGTTKVQTRGRDALQACFNALAAQGYRQHVTYQPARNFWALQVRETGVLLLLAGLLVWFSFWRIGRDVS